MLALSRAGQLIQCLGEFFWNALRVQGFELIATDLNVPDEFRQGRWDPVQDLEFHGAEIGRDVLNKFLSNVVIGITVPIEFGVETP